MTESAPAADHGWAGAWPDAVAFVSGLALAWSLGWNTTDLVWSLWLSSLVVGYAMIVWGIFSPAVLRLREGSAGAGAVTAFGGLFILAFFTFHFGMFHLVHSVFLNAFFPPDGVQRLGGTFGGLSLYVAVVKDYAWFLPIAFLAERRHFRFERVPPEPPKTSVKAADIAARKARQGFGLGGVMAPYKNVIRMHLLIFFFVAAHALKWEHFAVYVVVYAAYFFPWRLFSVAARRS